MNPAVGSYRAGASPLHRLPAWSKVLALFAWAVVTMIITDPVTAIGLCVAALLLLISILPPPKPTLKALGFILFVAAMTAFYQVYRGYVDAGIDIAADLVGLFALSLAVTGSTSMNDMLDFATRLARPFRRIVPPTIPGLMFAIMLRTIPEISRIMRESRDAARARGIRRNMTALMIPTATRTVGFALDLGAALHARGIGDEALADAPKRRRIRLTAPASTE
ncbi:energy-coupling factor transporter transmembrane component T family protein [Demequina lutea]|uniref:Biotin transport system permease protein n=1 Tax=Demequina lutea TaxID=431489 RepID=A0A7Z0CHL7_9MICO|nr:energy-coupling factor transporter transmembrane protein EcfT [Demequina lutea]NYI41611.1 biotin transport system permease protein [Demequina lutea]